MSSWRYNEFTQQYQQTNTWFFEDNSEDYRQAVSIMSQQNTFLEENINLNEKIIENIQFILTEKRLTCPAA